MLPKNKLQKLHPSPASAKNVPTPGVEGGRGNEIKVLLFRKVTNMYTLSQSLIVPVSPLPPSLPTTAPLQLQPRLPHFVAPSSFLLRDLALSSLHLAARSAGGKPSLAHWDPCKAPTPAARLPGRAHPTLPSRHHSRRNRPPASPAAPPLKLPPPSGDPLLQVAP